jgi:hypothetical protein
MSVELVIEGGPRVLLLVAYRIFKRLERNFADVV